MCFYLLGISFKSKPINWHLNPYIASFILSLVSILLYIIGCLIVFEFNQITIKQILSFQFLFTFISYAFTFISIVLVIILDDYNNVNTISYCEEILLNTFGKTMKPFVFLSAGMKFSNFYKSMSISMKLNINCLGFLCGRSLWQDSIDIFSPIIVFSWQ